MKRLQKRIMEWIIMRNGKKRRFGQILKRVTSVTMAAAIMLSAMQGSVSGYDSVDEPPATGAITEEALPLVSPSDEPPLPQDISGNEQPDNILPADGSQPVAEEPEDVPEPEDPALTDEPADYTAAELEELRYELSQVSIYNGGEVLRGLGYEGGTELDPRFNVLLTPEDMVGVYVPTSANKLFCRSALSPDEQSCYDIMLSAARSFHNSGSSAPLTQIGLAYACKTVELPKILNAAQLDTVFAAMVRDNPEFFWLECYSYSVGQDKILFSLLAKEDYVDNSVRMSIRNQADSGISALVSEAMALGSDYEKIKLVHDAICEQTVYAYDSYHNPVSDAWAHNIEGVFGPRRSAVCEGQAKAFSAVMNALGIENTIIAGFGSANGVSESHAWNAVKADGNSYYVEVTWDNLVPEYISKWLLNGTESFTEHQVMQGFNFLPAIYSADYIPPESGDPAATVKLTITEPPVGTLNCYINGVHVNNSQVVKGSVVDIVYTPKNADFPGELCLNGAPTASRRFYIYEDTTVSVEGLQMIVKSILPDKRKAYLQDDGTYLLDADPTGTVTLGFEGSDATTSMELPLLCDFSEAYATQECQNGTTFCFEQTYTFAETDNIKNPDNITGKNNIDFFGEPVEVTLIVDDIVPTNNTSSFTESARYGTPYNVHYTNGTNTYTLHKGAYVKFPTYLYVNGKFYDTKFEITADGQPYTSGTISQGSIQVKGSKMEIKMRLDADIEDVQYIYTNENYSSSCIPLNSVPQISTWYYYTEMEDEIEHFRDIAKDTIVFWMKTRLEQIRLSFNNRYYDFPITWTVDDISTIDVTELEKDQYIDVTGTYTIPDFYKDPLNLLPDELHYKVLLPPMELYLSVDYIGSPAKIELYRINDGGREKVEPIAPNDIYSDYCVNYNDIIEICSVNPEDVLEIYFNEELLTDNILTVDKKEYFHDIIPTLVIKAVNRDFDHLDPINDVSIKNGTAPDAQSFGLPETIKAYDKGGKEYTGDIDWRFTSYDRNRKDAYSITLFGDVALTDEMTSTAIQRVVSTKVTVSAAEEIPAEKISSVPQQTVTVRTPSTADALGLPLTVTGTAADETPIEFKAAWNLSGYNASSATPAEYTVTATLSAYGYKTADITASVRTVADDPTEARISMDLTSAEGDDSIYVVDPRTKKENLMATINIVLPQTDTNRTAVINLPSAFAFKSTDITLPEGTVSDAKIAGKKLTLSFIDNADTSNITFNIQLNINAGAEKAGAFYDIGEEIPIMAVYTAMSGGAEVTKDFTAGYAIMKSATSCFAVLESSPSFTAQWGLYDYRPSSSFYNITTSAEFINSHNSIYDVFVAKSCISGAPFIGETVVVELPMPDNIRIDLLQLSSSVKCLSYDSNTNTYMLQYTLPTSCNTSAQNIIFNALPLYAEGGTAADNKNYEAASTIKIHAETLLGKKKVVTDLGRKVKVICVGRSSSYSRFMLQEADKKRTVPILPAKDEITTMSYYNIDLKGGSSIPKVEKNCKVTLKAPEDHGAFITYFGLNFEIISDTTISNVYVISDDGRRINLPDAVFRKETNKTASHFYNPVLRKIADENNINIVEFSFTIDSFDYHDLHPTYSEKTNRSDLKAYATVSLAARQQDDNGEFSSGDVINSYLSIESDTSPVRTETIPITYSEPTSSGGGGKVSPSIVSASNDADKLGAQFTYYFMVTDDPGEVNRYKVDIASTIYSDKSLQNKDRKTVLIPKEGLRINMFEAGEFEGEIPAVLTLDDNTTVNITVTSGMKYVLSGYITDKRYIKKIELDMTDCCPEKLTLYPYGYLSAKYFLSQYPDSATKLLFDDNIPIDGGFYYEGNLISSASPSTYYTCAVLRLTDKAACEFEQTDIPISYPVDGFAATAKLNVKFTRNITESIRLGSDIHPDELKGDTESSTRAFYNDDFRMSSVGDYEMKFKLSDSFTYCLGSAKMDVLQRDNTVRTVSSKQEYLDADDFIHVVFDGKTVFRGSTNLSDRLSFSYLTDSDAAPTPDAVPLIVADSFSDSLELLTPKTKLESNGTEGAGLISSFSPVVSINAKAYILGYNVQGLSAYGYKNDESEQRGFGPLYIHGDAGESFNYVTKVRTQGSTTFNDITMYIEIPQLDRINSTASASYEQEWNAVLLDVEAPPSYVITGTTDPNPSPASEFSQLNLSDAAALAAVTMIKVAAPSAANGDEVTLSFVHKDGTSFSGNPAVYMFTSYNYSGMAAGRTEYTRVVSYALAHYSVKYELNGGDGTAPVDAKEYKNGESVELAEFSSYTRRGFRIKGWALTPSAGTPITSCAINGADVTLYAVWEAYNDPVLEIDPPEYSFTQRTKHQSSESKTITVTNTGLSDALNLSVSLNNDNFLLDAEGMPTKLAPNESTTFTVTPKDELDIADYLVTASVSSTNTAGVSSKLSLTVTDTPKYRVLYHGNGADSGTVPTDPRLYENGFRVDTMDGSLLRKENKEFAGWALSPDSPVAVTQTYISGANVNFYAIWNDITVKYKVTYELNGGAGTKPSDITDLLNGETAQLTDSTGYVQRENFLFKGWALTSSSNAPVSSVKINNKDVTVYAVWERDPAVAGLHVSYSLNGGMGSTPVDNQQYNENDPVTVKNAVGISKTNCVFAGWSEFPDGQTDIGPSFTITKDTILYAIWTPDKKHTVSYNINGGVGDAPVDGNEYSTDDIITLASSSGFSKEGFTFAGWTLTPNNPPISGSTYIMGTSNLLFIAVWRPIPVKTYSVIYHANGGTGEVPVDSIAYRNDNIANVITQTAVTRDGFTFGGWSLTQNGTAPVTSVTIANANVSLYAIWTPLPVKTYSVIYHANGGTGEVPVDGIAYRSDNIANVITQTAVTRDGFTFGGWSLTQNGTAPVTSVTIANAKVSLYAIWTPAAVTATTVTTPLTVVTEPLVPPQILPVFFPKKTAKTEETTKVEVAPEAGITLSDEPFFLGTTPGAANPSPLPVVFILLIISAAVIAKSTSKKNNRR